MKRRVGLAALVGGLGCAACAALADFDALHPVDVAVDGGDVHDAAAADAGPDCAHAGWPEPPDAAASRSATSFVNAMRWMSLHEDVDAASPVARGFDLDGVCGDSCVADTSHPDAPDGVDNAGGQFALFVAPYATRGAANPSVYLERGDIGVLIHVMEVDDVVNDDAVGVTFGLSRGVEPLSDDGGRPIAPKFDGSDVFATSVVSARTARAAYVSGATLVAKFDTLELPLGEARIELHGAVVVAALVSTPAGTVLTEGRIAGRWLAADLLAQGAGVLDGDGDPRCAVDGGLYQDLKTRICGAADVVADPGQDGKGARCDALSVVLRFEGAPALLGHRRDIEPTAQPCGATWSDACGR